MSNRTIARGWPERRHLDARNRRGFALVASLFLLVALSALSLQFSLESRARRLAAANIVEGAQAAAAATAGAEQARSRLSRMLHQVNAFGAIDPAALRDPWRTLDGVMPDSVTLGRSRARVILTDANASLNLNQADEHELQRLFAALRIDAGTADQLAQCIVDWRDADDTPHPRGAERETYIRDGLDVLPANAQFRSVSELRDVRGVSDSIFHLVRPYLTVEGSGLVNFNAAPRQVLLAVDGMTEEAVATLQRARDLGRPLMSIHELELALSPGSRRALQAGTPGVSARAAFETREVLVESEGWTSGSPIRAHAVGLAVRAGATALFVGRRSE